MYRNSMWRDEKVGKSDFDVAGQEPLLLLYDSFEAALSPVRRCMLHDTEAKCQEGLTRDLWLRLCLNSACSDLYLLQYLEESTGKYLIYRHQQRNLQLAACDLVLSTHQDHFKLGQSSSKYWTELFLRRFCSGCNQFEPILFWLQPE